MVGNAAFDLGNNLLVLLFDFITKTISNSNFSFNGTIPSIEITVARKINMNHLFVLSEIDYLELLL